MFISIFSLCIGPFNSITAFPKTLSETPVVIVTSPQTKTSSLPIETKKNKQNPKNIIAEYCRQENQWQQQLCYETHLAMLNNGSLKLDTEGENFIPTSKQESPDDMPLKEWARLFPIQ